MSAGGVGWLSSGAMLDVFGDDVRRDRPQMLRWTLALHAVLDVERALAARTVAAPALVLIGAGEGGPHFGSSIESTAVVRVPGYETGLPPALLELERFLLVNEGLYTPGIFRVPGERDCLRRLRAELRAGRSCVCRDALTAAHLINQWFRDLQLPLLSAFDHVTNHGDRCAEE